MRRRAFIASAGAAVAAPLSAWAQSNGATRKIGVLIGPAVDPEGQARLDALRQDWAHADGTMGRMFRSMFDGGMEISILLSHKLLS